jgi:cobalt/nickel transport system permease protein
LGKDEGDEIVHISEGVLSAPVLATGALLAAGGVAVGLKMMAPRDVPKVAVMSSAFFVASLIRVPVGPVSSHLVLNGLIGLVLGWMAVPSILVALLMQAILFQYGGLTTLGVNTFNMAAPAVLIYYIFSMPVRRGGTTMIALSGFLAGALGVALAALLVALSLVSTGEAFRRLAGLVLAAHIPVMLVEGVVTAFCVIFLKKVRPEVLEGKE